MIDIHSHLLYGVDDGAKTPEDSLKMLEQAAEQEITDIVLTPHYRKGLFPYPLEVIKERFLELVPLAKNLGITLHPGCEYFADSRIMEHITSGRCFTLNEGEYILLEFDYKTDYNSIRSFAESCIFCGFYPVIAHAERYEVFIKEFGLLSDFSKMGCLVQLNADSILGVSGGPAKRLCKRILKKELADIIASDCHDTGERGNRLRDGYLYVEKRFGSDTAKRLFVKNPAKILASGEFFVGKSTQ